MSFIEEHNDGLVVSEREYWATTNINIREKIKEDIDWRKDCLRKLGESEYIGWSAVEKRSVMKKL